MGGGGDSGQTEQSQNLLYYCYLSYEKEYEAWRERSLLCNISPLLAATANWKKRRINESAFIKRA